MKLSNKEDCLQEAFLVSFTLLALERQEWLGAWVVLVLGETVYTTLQ